MNETPDFLIKALQALVPKAQFISYGGKLELLDWKDERPKPSNKQINDKVAELKAEYEANQYQRDRETSYPSIQEQLDMQYWDAVNGTKKWQEAVAKVKTDNPKPE